jgi:hypothetical protein
MARCVRHLLILFQLFELLRKVRRSRTIRSNRHQFAKSAVIHVRDIVLAPIFEEEGVGLLPSLLNLFFAFLGTEEVCATHAVPFVEANKVTATIVGLPGNHGTAPIRSGVYFGVDVPVIWDAVESDRTGSVFR